MKTCQGCKKEVKSKERKFCSYDCYWKSKKGKQYDLLNTGGGFHKGHKHTKKMKDKMSKDFKGKHFSPATEFNGSYSGNKHYLWKENDVGYTALHEWVVRHLGNPNVCEHCNKSGLTEHKIHWANKSHKYKRELEDWLRLCVKCHWTYDREQRLTK